MDTQTQMERKLTQQNKLSKQAVPEELLEQIVGGVEQHQERPWMFQKEDPQNTAANYR